MSVYPEQFSLKLTLRCKDYQASRRFYHEILGLHILDEWEEPGGKGCIFGVDQDGIGGQFEIYEMNQKDTRYQSAFSKPLVTDKLDLQLKTSSLDYWIASLNNAWPIEGPEILPWGHRWIKLRDPDNFLIAIYEEVE